MSCNWSELQKSKAEVKEKKRAGREKLAGFFYDLSKLVFAGLVVGGISPIFTDLAPTAANIVIIVSGMALTIALAYFANRIMNN